MKGDGIANAIGYLFGGLTGIFIVGVGGGSVSGAVLGIIIGTIVILAIGL